MTKAVGSALSVLVCILGVAQIRRGPQQRDRPVFMSAQRLAILCSDWGASPPGSQLNVSAQALVRGTACEAYIFGVYDQGLDSLGFRYRPVQGEQDFVKPLIDGFLKRLAEHPEEQSLAASTLLHEAEKGVGDIPGGH